MEGAMEELRSGYEIAKQLIDILQQQKTQAIGSDDELTIGSSNQSTKDLLKKILESFDGTISILTTSKSTSSLSSSSLSSTNNSVESDEVVFLPQSQSQLQFPVLKDLRGCHKRQGTSQKLTKENSMLSDDGHAWRKYGQKHIRDSKYPREYFRCTYKFDQHCKATKQVERIEDNPPKYRTTYFGPHTCKKIETPPQIMSCDDDDDEDDSSILFNFETSNIKYKKQKNVQITLPIFPCPSTDPQCAEEDFQNSKSSLLPSIDMSPEDLTSIFEEFDAPIMSPRMSMETYKDIITSSWSLDVDINHMIWL